MKRVLVVDDEEYMRHYLGRFIEKQGYEVFTASTGQEALDIYRTNHPDYVFLDVVLPDIRGTEVFRKLREFYPEARVSFITGNEGVVTELQSQNLDTGKYLVKPIILDDVLKILNTV